LSAPGFEDAVRDPGAPEVVRQRFDVLFEGSSSAPSVCSRARGKSIAPFVL
jgi:hypothetical protein